MSLARAFLPSTTEAFFFSAIATAVALCASYHFLGSISLVGRRQKPDGIVVH